MAIKVEYGQELIDAIRQCYPQHPQLAQMAIAGNPDLPERLEPTPQELPDVLTILTMLESGQADELKRRCQILSERMECARVARVKRRGAELRAASSRVRLVARTG